MLKTHKFHKNFKIFFIKGKIELHLRLIFLTLFVK